MAEISSSSSRRRRRRRSRSIWARATRSWPRSVTSSICRQRDLGVDIEKTSSPSTSSSGARPRSSRRSPTARRRPRASSSSPDPDREGEAIAWHIAERIERVQKGRPRKGRPNHPPRPLQRDHRKRGVGDAIKPPTEHQHRSLRGPAGAAHPRQARGLQDQPAPLGEGPPRTLRWQGAVGGGAHRLRARGEIRKFGTKEYWSIVANLEGASRRRSRRSSSRSTARISRSATATTRKDRRRDQAVRRSCSTKITEDGAQAQSVAAVHHVEAAAGGGAQAGLLPRRRRWRSRRCSTRAWSSATRAPVGLITYMRTDSVRVGRCRDRRCPRLHSEASTARDRFRTSRSITRAKKGAQDAHEAITPDVAASIRPRRSRSISIATPIRLYDLIWKRFVASQMKPAVYDQTSFDIEAGTFLLRATGQVHEVPGLHLRLHGGRGRGEGEGRGGESRRCPTSPRARNSSCSA